ncbi:uncharacterized protein KGF55_003466 [Candida pseudojiufengensis]|uniref:uncharacterized protein n=1 Tax=Candida pseudojiufengensis TaxID=497109 RepID=UPI002224A4EC|nr:uncharacterized protein KGF55_003466 [Candida pseudojiufengensis]KAI5962390.1 hypothetical protein KGF55_003466 [Candida pseudojiufengensis]
MSFKVQSPDLFERQLTDPEYPGEGEAFYQFKSYKELQSWIEVRNLYTPYTIQQTKIFDIGEFELKENSKNSRLKRFGFARHGYQKLVCHLHKKRDRSGEDKQLIQLNFISPSISTNTPLSSCSVIDRPASHHQLPTHQPLPRQQIPQQPFPHQQFSQQPPPHQQIPHQSRPCQQVFIQQLNVQQLNVQQLNVQVSNPTIYVQTPSQPSFNGQFYNRQQPFSQPYNGQQPFCQPSSNKQVQPIQTAMQNSRQQVNTSNSTSNLSNFNQMEHNEIYSNSRLHSFEEIFPTITYKKPLKFKTSQPSNKNTRGCKSSITISLVDYVYNVTWKTSHDHDYTSRDYANKLPVHPIVKKYIFNLYLYGVQTESISRMIRKLQNVYKNDKFMFNELLKLDIDKLNNIRLSVVEDSKNIIKGINDVIEKIDLKDVNNENSKAQNNEETLPGSQSNPIEI